MREDGPVPHASPVVCSCAVRRRRLVSVAQLAGVALAAAAVGPVSAAAAPVVERSAPASELSGTGRLVADARSRSGMTVLLGSRARASVHVVTPLTRAIAIDFAGGCRGARLRLMVDSGRARTLPADSGGEHAATVTQTLAAGPHRLALSATYPRHHHRCAVTRVGELDFLPARPADGVTLGAAVRASNLPDRHYAAAFTRYYGSLTPENEMKMLYAEPAPGVYDFAPADRLVNFAIATGKLLRGHTLVYGNQLPDWVTSPAVPWTRDSLLAVMRDYITTMMRHFAGRVEEWDVVNEAFNEDGTLRDNLWLQKIGPSYIEKAFTWAHQADPKALLFYNDYNLEYGGPKQDGAYDLVKGLVRKGVPIDGVGFQTHLDTQYDIPDLETTMKRFAKLGLKTAETEVDVRTTLPVTSVELSAQKAGYAETLQACLLVKACISYTVWGFGDAYSWIPGVFPGEGAADVYDDHLVAKPEYTALQTVLRTAKSVPHRN
ncbi:MAG: endo,4-beta-xylanase [Gaiellales bacterium]|nr:endo,4-beta-xylanase [Gaiellales bacterium]